MSGRRWLQPWERADIAAAVKAARAQGVGWKDLEDRFGRSRWQLKRYLADPLGAGSRDERSALALAPACENATGVSHETMHQKTSGMHQQGGCIAPEAA